MFIKEISKSIERPRLIPLRLIEWAKIYVSMPDNDEFESESYSPFTNIDLRKQNAKKSGSSQSCSFIVFFTISKQTPARKKYEVRMATNYGYVYFKHGLLP